MNQRMPVLFLGHGSPMNAIEDNPYTQFLKQLAERIPRPRAILCISAHWMSEGSWITHMERPKTIHDFYGFPKPLFDVQYPAHADLKLADRIIDKIKSPPIIPDREQWGYDHGTWSVLRHIYPKADIPLLQLSLYMEQPGEYHLKLGEELRFLRDDGVLILGSGNIVHNLRAINWTTHAGPYDWAVECDEWMKSKIEQKDFKALASDVHKFDAGRMSVPTWDHYYPLLYVLGASHPEEKVKFEFEEIHNASISMRSLSFGLP
jgi:4,5-DOPA dioxygenase extradiol